MGPGAARERHGRSAAGAVTAYATTGSPSPITFSRLERAVKLGGHHQPRELVRDPLLADEERGQAPQHRVALGLVHRFPVAPVLLEVDLVRGPVLALP